MITVGRKRYQERQDFSYLMKELKEAPVKSVEMKDPVKVDNVISIHRARILSDPKIKYLYSDKDHILHDKSCADAKNIPDEELTGLTEFKTDMKLCCNCAEKAIVRNGAADMKQYGEYNLFFIKAHLRNRLVRKLYIDQGAKTELVGKVMNIAVHEDKWKLVLQEDGGVKLLHNNYRRNRDGSRSMGSGYHEQWIGRLITGEMALEYICAYSWEKHYEQFAKEREQKESTSENETVSADLSSADLLSAYSAEASTASTIGGRRLFWVLKKKIVHLFKHISDLLHLFI